MERLEKAVRERRLFRAGERVAVAVSGGADSVALLHGLTALRGDLGIVLSVAHFHHGIRGAEADLDLKFVRELAEQLDLPLLTGSGDAPRYAQEHRLSLETAARELRHQWFAGLVKENRVDKIATAHTLDDQAETVLMRLVRGAGARGLAGISGVHKEKALVRPLLEVTRREIEAYLNRLGQSWREDSTNQDLLHTRNRVRHTLLPLLEREFNPSVKQTLADLAEVSQTEADYWEHELREAMPRVVREGKPTRSGRASTGEAAGVWSVDLSAFQGLHPAMQRQVLHKLGTRLGVALESKHIQELISFAARRTAGKKLLLPGRVTARCTLRELQLGRSAEEEAKANYCYSLSVPGEVSVSVLGSAIRARIITAESVRNSGYNPSLLLDRGLLESELKVRNWRAGDRFFPAHSQSPKKVKELLQAARLGRPLSPTERYFWPVIENAGQIVWMRGFPVPAAFAHRKGDAVLIEEILEKPGTS